MREMVVAPTIFQKGPPLNARIRRLEFLLRVCIAIAEMMISTTEIPPVWG
jgi:hypothetical protein